VTEKKSKQNKENTEIICKTFLVIITDVRSKTCKSSANNAFQMVHLFIN